MAEDDDVEQRLEIRILGPLEVADGTGVVELGGLRQRALLALLAVAANRVVSADALIDQRSRTAVRCSRGDRRAHPHRAGGPQRP